ncbi:MAG: prepilin-type N-terminal cleavage/methylation domain-containing protein [Methylobacter sp.]|nr:MAG: prepilin-type N-terminal cleavage/methylation domain-containing protein [Methylobacter sp.]
MSRHKHRHAGFTLVELIMVMVITGILSAVVVVFMKRPVDQYMDIARRAEMTDIADTALRRIGRDIRIAVPNSVRLPTPEGSTYIEFLPTKSGGRYRAAPAPSGTAQCGGTLAEDILDFAIADSCFEIIGPAIDFAVGDRIVVGSTQFDGNPPYDSSATGVLRAYTGTAGSQTVVNISGTQFPSSAQLPGQRFDVVPGDQQAVTYACENVGGAVDGTGTLRRYWAYGFNVVQVVPPLAGSSALLADKISACSIVYSMVSPRDALVVISLTITRGGESISLYQEIHVNNMP